MAFFSAGCLTAHAGNATWTSTSNGNWSTGSVWSTLAAPGSTLTTTNTDTATFSGTTGVTVSIDQTNQDIGSILFSGTVPGAYTFSGGPLLLSSGGSITDAGAAKTTQTFYTSLVLEPVTATSNGTYTFTTASASLGQFVFNGGISGGTTTGTVGLNLGVNTFASTINGAISDGGAAGGLSVTQSAGNWTLAGTNTYTGPTTVTGGTLSLTGSLSSSSSLVVGDGGVFSNAPSSNHGQTLNGLTVNGGLSSVNDASGITLSLGAVTRNPGGMVVFNNGTTGTITTSTANTSGILAPWAVTNIGGIAYATVGSGSSINSYSGGAAGTSGSLANMTNAGTNYSYFVSSPPETVNLTGDITGNTFESESGALTIANGGHAITLNGILASSSLTINGAGNLIMGATNELDIMTGSATTTIGSAITGGGPLVFGSVGLGSGKLILSGGNTYSGGTVINSGTVALSGSGTLGALSNSLTIYSGALDLGGTNQTIGNIIVPGGSIFNSATGTTSTLTFGSSDATGGILPIIKDNTGTGGVVALVKTGAGSFTVTAAETYSGGTTINGGLLQASGNGKFSSTSGSLTVSAGALDLNGTSQGFGNLSGSGGAILNSAVGTTSALTIGTSDATGGNFTGVIEDNSGTGGVIALTKTGAGTIALSGANTYSGGTTLNGGVLSLGSVGALGTSGAITFNGGTLQFSSSNTTDYSSRFGTSAQPFAIDTNGQSVTFTANLNANFGPFTKMGTGNLTLGGTDAFATGMAIQNGTLILNSFSAVSSGGVTLGSGTTSAVLQLGDGVGAANLSTTSLTVSGSGTANTVVGGTSAAVSTLTVGSNLSATFAGQLGGATATSQNLALIKNGTGTIDLTNANTYTGTTSIQQGTLQLGGTLGGLSSATSIILSSTGNNSVLQLGDGTAAINQTVAGLTALAGNTFDDAVVGGSSSVSTLTVNTSSTDTYAGILGSFGTNNNNLKLVKSGSGTLILTGSNSYTGSTTIQSGILSISSVAGAGSSLPANTLTFTGSSSSSPGVLQYTGATGTLGQNLTVSSGDYGVVDNTGGGVLTLSGTLSKNGSVLTLAGGKFVVSGQITGANANSDLDLGSAIYPGSATVGLTVANTYNGPTVITNGSTLLTGIAGALPTSTPSAVTLGSSSDTAGQTNTIDLLGTAQIVVSLAAAGPGTNQIISSNGTASGTPAIGASASSSPGTLTVNYSGGGTDTFSGSLGGTGVNNFGLTKLGTGRLALTGINTYTGATNIQQGTLGIGGGSSIGNGTGTALTLGSGTNNGVLLLGDNSGGATVTLSNLTTSGSGTANVILGNSSSYSTIVLNTGTSQTYTGYIGTTSYDNSDFSPTIPPAANTNLNLVKTGSGIFNLQGVDFYTGTTTIQQGTLEISGALENGFFSPTAVTLGSGTNSGVLQVFGQAFISSLTISGTGTANAVIGGGSLVIQSPSSFTFGGTIGSKIANNNALSLAVFTGGVLDLTGVNTYTGGTAIDEGALQIGGGSSIGGTAGTALYLGLQPLSGQLILGDSTGIGNAAVSTITNQSNGTGAANSIVGGNAANSTLTITGTTGFTGSIGGTGTNNNNLNLVISSTGNFNLSSIATYTGSTTINGGALTISSPATLTNSITVNGGILAIASGGSIAQVSGVNLAASGATFDITNAGNQTIQDLSGVSGTGVLLLGNTLTEGTSNSTTFAGTIQNETIGNATLIKQGSGTLTLTGSVSALNLSINGGVLNSGASGALSGTNQITFGGGTLQYSAAEGTDYSRRIVNSSGAISIDTNGRNVSFSSSLAASNSGGFTKLGAGTLTLSASNQYTGTTTVAGGTLNLISAGALNSTGNIAFTGGQLLYTTTNTVDYSSRIVNSSSAISINDGSGQNITYASALAASNSGGLSKLGFGTLTLTGANLYTGTTTLASGTLNVGSIGALNNTGNITFILGSLIPGILQYSAVNQVDYSSRIVNSRNIELDTNGQNVTFASALTASNTGGLTKLGAGTLTLAANNAYAGATGVSAGTLQVGNGGTTGSLSSGNVSVTGTLAYDRSDNISNGSIISGAGTLLQMGAGALTLTGVNTFTGATSVTAGTLAFGSIAANGVAQPLGEGTGAILLGNGTLQYTGGTNVTAFGRSVTVTSGTAGAISNTGGGTLTLTGGTLTKTGSTLALKGGNFVINDVITSDRVADTSFNSDMSFSAGGTVTLNVQNTYFGPTFIDTNTTVQNGVSNALPTDTVLTLGSNGTSGKLDLGGFNQTLAGLTTSGSGTANLITNGAAGSGTNILTVDNDTTTSNSNYTFSGSIQDGLTAHIALVKTGDQTLTLTGVNTYSGGTAILAGTLAISGSIVGNVTVGSGAEFDGHGSISGTIGGAGAVGPGNSPGILTAGQVDPSGGLSFNLEFTQAGQPTFSNPAASGNDVLHLTSGTPFLSALTSANAINLYFSSVGTFDGGFFVNGATDDLTSNIGVADYIAYILDNASGTFIYNGNKYDLASTDDDTLLTRTLAIAGADFADGVVMNGHEGQFVLASAVASVPEPSAFALGLGGLVVLGLALRRKLHLIGKREAV